RLGRGQLLADAGERCRERRIDAALGFLDRVRGRVAPLALPVRARPALGSGGRRRRRRGTRLGQGPNGSLLGLLQAEAEAVTLGVEADDLELEVLALVDHVAGMGDPLVAQLA